MPENYIAMFNAPRKEQARSIVEQAEPELQKVLTQLKAGKEFPPPRENLYDRFMSGPVNPVFYRFFVKAEPSGQRMPASAAVSAWNCAP